MAVEWKTVRLSDVAHTRNGAGIKQDAFSETGVPLARISDFTDWSINMAACIRVDFEHAKRWEGHRLNEGEAVVATVGSWPPNWSSVVGKAVRVPRAAVGAIQNQNTCCVLSRPSISDQRFLFYLLRTEEFAHYAANSATGSASQARLPVANLERFEFRLPPLTEQKSIATVLGALDDKIELNRRMIATLYAMVGALFQSWFVDFDPVRARLDGRLPSGMDGATAALFPDGFHETSLGNVPDGWLVRPLSEIMVAKNARVGSLEVPEYSSTNDGLQPRTERFKKKLSASNAANKLIHEGDLVFGLSREVLNFGLMKDNCGCVSPAYKVFTVDRNSIVPDLLERMMRQRPAYFFNAVSSSSREGQSISSDALTRLLVLQPPREAQVAFYEQTKPYLQLIVSTESESHTLASLRDTLLPKLLSGELSALAANATTEEVLK